MTAIPRVYIKYLQMYSLKLYKDKDCTFQSQETGKLTIDLLMCLCPENENDTTIHHNLENVVI